MHRTSTPRFARRQMLTSLVGGAAIAAAAPIVTSTAQAAAMKQPASDRDATPIDLLNSRGEVLAATPIATMNVDEVVEYVSQIDLDTQQARFGVDALQVVYATVDPDGEPTIASGLVALPQSEPTDVQLVSWLHGTTVYRGDAASVSMESADRMIAFAFASAGYAVSAPDYLGLGLGPGFHPYDHVPSTVTASIDALRATSSLADRQNRQLGDRVFVTGFSQGGPATLALGEALQSGADPSFRPGALAPISGPYDFTGTLQAGLTGDISSAPQYLAYLMVAWNRLHGLYDSSEEAFLSPYASVVETLIDGNHTADEVFEGIPVSAPDELFTPEFLDRMQSPTGALRDALATANATCDWRPDVPVVLYASSGDLDVPIANAEYGQETLERHGAKVRLVDVGDVDHSGSVVLSVPRVMEQFANVAVS